MKKQQHKISSSATESLTNVGVERKKIKRRNKSDFGVDFVAPDGGWGWVVCIAAGFSTLCVFAPVQQYGIIYRQRLYDLGFDAKQIATIINWKLGIAAMTGITNGALFRRFTVRQTALVGGLFIFLGVFLTAFCAKFAHYFLCFSLLYGVGMGMHLSALGLAVNVYFKEYLCRATGFSTALTGLGSILMPHICLFLLQEYSTQGTILIIAALSLNTLSCALTLQPVTWHVKPKRKQNVAEVLTVDEAKNLHERENIKDGCTRCQQQRKKSEWNIFSADNLESDQEDVEMYEYELNATLASYNDGWLSSIESLNSIKSKKMRRQKSVGYNEGLNEAGNVNVKNYRKSFKNNQEESFCTCFDSSASEIIHEQFQEKHTKINSSVVQKVIKFFDLDLLADLTFVNLVQGTTVMTFCELNFSFLTPFILGSFHYNNEQISIAMSTMAAVDVAVRFITPLIFERVNISSVAFFAFGIIILLLGRVIITMIDSFNILLTVFAFMGFGKGFRTIYARLILPDYLPLNRLAAGNGLQLFINALFTMAFGPVLGFIADISSYTVAIHFMNLMTTISLLLWGVQWLVGRVTKNAGNVTEIL